MNRRSLLKGWLWRLPLVLLGFTTFSYAEKASAWNWDDVQRWAYEVEDRSDEVYELAWREALQSNPDQEYALELLWDLSVKADIFSSRVNSYPWGASSITRNDYHALYVSFHRADQAMELAPFSYAVRSAFARLSWSMDRLRVEYQYSYIHDGWQYRYWRDHWYFELRYRHQRDHYWRLRSDRIERRRLTRHRWDERYRNDQRRRAYERVRRDRMERERLERDRWERTRRDRTRDRLDRDHNRDRSRDRITPPNRDRTRDRVRPPTRDRVDRDRGRGGQRDRPARRVRTPRGGR